MKRPGGLISYCMMNGAMIGSAMHLNHSLVQLCGQRLKKRPVQFRATLGKPPQGEKPGWTGRAQLSSPARSAHEGHAAKNSYALGGDGFG